ncbi:HNH endonuclease [Chloroflexota bacterium]
MKRSMVFELSPISAFDEEQSESKATEDDLWSLSLNTLRDRALQAPTKAREPGERRQLIRHRSAVIRTYVLKRAKGQCEGCGSPVPFTSETGRPYLEPHHIRRLSDGGPDHPDWVAALCRVRLKLGWTPSLLETRFQNTTTLGKISNKLGCACIPKNHSLVVYPSLVPL